MSLRTDLLIIVATIVLFAVCVPQYVASRTHTSRDACIANLKQMNGDWALKTHPALTNVALAEHPDAGTNAHLIPDNQAN
jgi:hypothetical protein